MEKLPTPQDIEIMAVRAGLAMTAICARAGVSPHVFFGWKAGKTSPTLSKLEAIIAELEQAIASRRAPERTPE